MGNGSTWLHSQNISRNFARHGAGVKVSLWAGVAFSMQNGNLSGFSEKLHYGGNLLEREPELHSTPKPTASDFTLDKHKFSS